jgi:subtilisin family serine protease
MKKCIFLTAVFALLSASSLLAADYREGEVIVKFRKNSLPDERNSFYKKAGITKRVKALRKNTELLSLPDGRGVMDAVKLYGKEPLVEYAEPNYLIKKAAIPDDAQFSLQWGLTKINAPGAWDLSSGSASVTVAILDTGADLEHPDLKANIWVNADEAQNGIDDDGNGYVDDIKGWNFVNSGNMPFDDNTDGHGTHVAGIIGASGNNGIGVSGINWSVSLMILKILDKSGTGTVADEARAIEYAIENGARVINASYAFPTSCTFVLPSITEKDAIEDAMNNGILFVAAAGNGGCNADNTPFYPAGYSLRNIISISASNESDSLISASNYGYESVHAAAPGNHILSTFPGNAYAYLSGTSLSAPHVSGLAALMLSYRPDYDFRMLKETILSTVDKTQMLSGKSLSDGRINAYRAITSPWPPGYPPVRPTGLGVLLEGESALISFSDNSSVEDGFEIVRSEGNGQFITLSVLGPDVTSTVDSSILDGKLYTYMVRGFNSYGNSGFSLPASMQTQLNPPSGLDASASSNSVSLSWADNSSSEEGYKIERAASGGDFSLIATVGENAESYTDGGLSSNTSYTYRVYAFNSLGISGYSNTATANTTGGSSTGGGGGGCFIATAAWGDPEHPAVKILRKFRELHLNKSKAGVMLVKLYYKLSPPVASFIGENEYLMLSARALLMPVVIIIAVYMSPAGSVVLLVSGFFALLILKRKRH